jgi:hypothetical protein
VRLRHVLNRAGAVYLDFGHLQGVTRLLARQLRRKSYCNPKNCALRSARGQRSLSTSGRAPLPGEVGDFQRFFEQPSNVLKVSEHPAVHMIAADAVNVWNCSRADPIEDR